MLIVNNSDTDVTWWCYNSDDGVQAITLKQGDLSANGGRVSYDPPNNTTGKYKLKITVPGGGGYYVPGPRPSGTLGDALVGRGDTVTFMGSCGYEVALVGGPGTGGGIDIVNESDIGMTWWCYNSDDLLREIPLKRGDVPANGGRVSYSPQNNNTGAYYMLITRLGASATYRDWAPNQSAALGRGDIRPGGTITLRGSCRYNIIGGNKGYQVG